jgi:hypothetical protein
MKNEIKKEFKEALANTSCHGASNLIKTNNLLLKTLWILAIVTSISGCSYLIVKSIVEYLKFEVVTNIKVIKEFDAEFPMITFCNENGIVTREGQELYRKFKEKTYPHILNNFTNDEKKRMGFNLSDILIECKFRDQFCDLEKDFVWYFDAEFGVCYRFNSGYDQSGRYIGVKHVRSANGPSHLSVLFLYVNENIEDFNLFSSNSSCLLV